MVSNISTKSTLLHPSDQFIDLTLTKTDLFFNSLKVCEIDMKSDHEMIQFIMKAPDLKYSCMKEQVGINLLETYV